jgi:hypothetical protein
MRPIFAIILLRDFLFASTGQGLEGVGTALGKPCLPLRVLRRAALQDSPCPGFRSVEVKTRWGFPDKSSRGEKA